MYDCGLEFATRKTTTPVYLVCAQNHKQWLKAQHKLTRAWLKNTAFKPDPGETRLIPDEAGGLRAVVAGVDVEDATFCAAALPDLLPPGLYRLYAPDLDLDLGQAEIGWALASYRFDRYKKLDRAEARLRLNPSSNRSRVENTVAAIFLTRDLINTAAEDLMPKALFMAFKKMGGPFGAKVSQFVGKALLKENFPAIHAVGRASPHAPRLIELNWGAPDHPRITLVGKGVCFDSGGLNIKPATGMRLMKKDMGGAAIVAGLARLIMSSDLPVRLRVLIPAVENAVAANAYRPGDVVTTRKGISVEIDNTDAEGRMVLADALAYAEEGEPDLVMDFATLTGAARVALGTDLPGYFTRDQAVAAELERAAGSEQDPIWRLPLHKPYRPLLESRVADILNCAASPYGGAIAAGLFLGEFVSEKTPWLHFDLMGWNNRAQPGRPEGGEAMTLRAVFRFLQARYGG